MIPDPLPPKPSIEWTPELRSKFDHALLALGRLDSIRLGIVRELTSRKRNRIFSYAGYLEIINQGMELPD